MKRWMPIFLTLGMLLVPAAKADPAAHRQLVARLLEVFRVAPMCAESLHAIVGEAVRTDPRLTGAEGELVAFLEETTGWEVIKPAVIELYMAKFTEGEMREIIRFYESPTGRKFAGASLDISAEVMGLVQDRMAKATDDWELLLAEILQRSDRKDSTRRP